MTGPALLTHLVLSLLALGQEMLVKDGVTRVKVLVLLGRELHAAP